MEDLLKMALSFWNSKKKCVFGQCLVGFISLILCSWMLTCRADISSWDYSFFGDTVVEYVSEISPFLSWLRTTICIWCASHWSISWSKWMITATGDTRCLKKNWPSVGLHPKKYPQIIQTWTSFPKDMDYFQCDCSFQRWCTLSLNQRLPQLGLMFCGCHTQSH